MTSPLTPQGLPVQNNQSTIDWWSHVSRTGNYFRRPARGQPPGPIARGPGRDPLEAIPVSGPKTSMLPVPRPPGIGNSEIPASPATPGVLGARDSFPSPAVRPVLRPEDTFRDFRRISDPGLRIMKDFMDAGFPRHVAAAFAGNFDTETGGFRHVQEQKPLAGRGGVGIAQWTGSRRRKFEAFAEAMGASTSDYAPNIQFALQEILADPYESRVLDRLKAAKTPEEAARIISETYLRPGIPHMNKRMIRARAYYDAPEFVTDEANAPARRFDRKNGNDARSRDTRGNNRSVAERLNIFSTIWDMARQPFK